MPAKSVAFNAQQQAVVNFRRGYAVIMACPGSGKTEVVITRVRRMLNEGVKPSEILSSTFTKEGAKEMTERAGLGDIKEKIFTTFHSWALAFIKKEALALPFTVHMDFHGNPSPLCLPLQAARTMAQICRRIANIQWKDAASYTSTCKRRGITPNMAAREAKNEQEEAYALAYAKYDESLRSQGLLDFDSIIIETARLLEQREDVRARWQYKFVQVDEAQDTDSVQWRIVKAVSEAYESAIAVGDENQGMYSWRGSESNLTEYFTTLFPTAAILPLAQNYRSTGAIVEYCKQIAPMQNDTVAQFHTANDRGTDPTYALYERDDLEANAILDSAQQWEIRDRDSTHVKGKLSIAVLARTNRQLAAFEDACGTRNIKYKLLGKSGFWGQPEVKDTIAIIGSVAMPSDNNILRMLTARCDATKFVRKQDVGGVAGTPTLLKAFQERSLGPDSKPVLLHRLLSRYYSGDTQQDDIVREIGRTVASLRASTANMSGKPAAEAVSKAFGLLSHYDVVEEEGEDKHPDNDPRDNILKLMEYAARYKSLADFYEYTQRVRRANLARTSCLILSTIHQAKGKEWGTVFVAGVNQDVLPHAKGDELEERKIYFVACSRAARRLHVSASGVPSILIRDKVPAVAKDEQTLANEKLAEQLDPWAGFELRG